MDDKTRDLNIRIMQEAGLEEGDCHEVVDQDTGSYFSFRNKRIITPDAPSRRDGIHFDPVNNVKMMSMVFSYAATKLAEEEGINPAMCFYPVEGDPVKGTKRMVVVSEDNVRRESKPYVNDALCYADLLLQINGEGEVDLSEYDMTKEELQAKRNQMRPGPQKPTPKKRETKR